MTVTLEGASRLVALVRVDIVGSTAALAADGIAAAVADRRLLMDIVEHAAALVDGWVVDTQGDAVVLACMSAVDALAGAGRIATETRAAPFEVRIGMTIGELPVEQDRFGTVGEVVAERLDAAERRAMPGQITVDDVARRALAATPELGAEHATEAGAEAARHRVTDPRPAIGGGLATELRAVMFSQFAVDGGTAPDDVWQRSLPQLLDESARLVADAGGEIVDDHGPGHVAVFRSGRAALVVADAIHAAVATRNLRSGAGVVVRASLSLAVGEVTVEGDDCVGRPIVEAARLLHHADGATAVTADVATLAGLSPDDAEVLGTFAFKGFDEDTTILRISPAGPPALVDLPIALRRAVRFDFAGRRNDLDVLRSAWRSACDGAVRGVLISGEEGSGKSRLARELAHEAAAEGAIVLLGTAVDELARPYATIGQALAPAAAVDATLAAAFSPRAGQADAARVGAVEAADAVDTLGSALRRALGPGPDVIERVAAGGAGDIDRLEFFTEVGACLGRLAELRPVLLVVDDLQWVGADTIELMEHLLAEGSPQRLMVLGTVRSEHLRTDDPFNRLLDSPRIARQLVHRALRRLDSVEVGEMLSSRNKGVLDQAGLDFVAEVTRATGGSPLFVEELVVHLVGTGVLADHGGHWKLAVDVEQIPIPGTVLDLMAHRLARLDAAAVELLSVAAVIGHSFAADLVADVSGRLLEDVVDVVDAAAVIGLVHSDNLSGSFSFADEITREAALQLLRPARRALLHRSVAAVLATQRPEPVDALAYHWGEAIGRDATEQAVHYQRLAAGRDMAAAAWGSAIERLRQVMANLDALGEDDDRVRAEVHYDLGFSLRMIGDEAHGPDLIEAGNRARRLNDGPLLARAAMAMMRPGAWYPEAAVVDGQISEMYEDALFLLDADDPIRPRVLAGLATNLTYHHDADRRWELLREAQRSAAEVGDRWLMAVADAAELIACQDPDLIERRWELACDVRRAGRAFGDRDLAFTGGLFMMLEHIGRGEFAEAERMAVELREVADAGGTYWPRYVVAQFQSLTAILRCSPDALDVIEAERAAFEDQPVDWFGMSVIQQAVVAMGKGTLADMLLPFAEALGQYEGNDEWARKWDYAVAKAYLDTGRLDEAVSVIERSPAPDFDRYWVASMHHLGQLGLALDRSDICERVLDELMPYRGRFAIIGVGAAVSGQVSTALGQAALGLGRLGLAEELFREAVEQAEAVEAPFFATLARRHLAMTLARSDRSSREARDLLAVAASSAERHGFALEASAIEALRAELG